MSKHEGEEVDPNALTQEGENKIWQKWIKNFTGGRTKPTHLFNSRSAVIPEDAAAETQIGSSEHHNRVIEKLAGFQQTNTLAEDIIQSAIDRATGFNESEIPLERRQKINSMLPEEQERLQGILARHPEQPGFDQAHKYLKRLTRGR